MAVLGSRLSSRTTYGSIAVMCGCLSFLSMGLLLREVSQPADVTQASNIDTEDMRRFSDRALANLADDNLMSNYRLATSANDILLSRSRDCIECLHRAIFLSLWDNDSQFKQKEADYLRESYTLSPLGDLSVMQWRVTISRKYWDSLPPDLKDHARHQIKGLNASRPGREWLQRHGIQLP